MTTQPTTQPTTLLEHEARLLLRLLDDAEEQLQADQLDADPGEIALAATYAHLRATLVEMFGDPDIERRRIHAEREAAREAAQAKRAAERKAAEDRLVDLADSAGTRTRARR